MSNPEASKLPRRDAVILLVVVAFAWGTTWPVIKAILVYMPPFWTIAWRSVAATVALFAISALRRHIVVPKRGDLPLIANVVSLHMIGFATLVAVAMQFVPAGRSVVLGYTTPLWVMIGARLFLGELFTRWRLLGIALGFVGLGLLFNPAGFDWHNSNTVIGNILILLAALLWSVSILHLRAHRWVSSPLELAPWQALIATLILVPMAIVAEGWPSIDWDAGLVGLLMYGGVFGVAVPYWAQATVNRNLPAVTTAIGMLGVPVVGVLFSALMLGEPLTFTLVAAMLCIIAGIAFGNGGSGLPRRSR